MADFAVSSYGKVVVYVTQDGSVAAIQVSVDGTWTPLSNPSATPTAALSPMPSLSALPTTLPSGSLTASPSGSPTMTALIHNGVTPAPVSTVPSIAPSVAPLRGPSTSSEHFAHALGHFAIDYQSTVGHTCQTSTKQSNVHLCVDCFTTFHTIEETKQLQLQFPHCVKTVSNYGGQRQCGYCQQMTGNGPIATMNGHVGLTKNSFTSHTIDNCNGIKGNAMSHVWHTTT